MEKNYIAQWLRAHALRWTIRVQIPALTSYAVHITSCATMDKLIYLSLYQLSHL